MEAAAPSTELREIHGPSAVGGGWRRFFDLLWLLAINEFKTSFVGTALGYVWSLVRPLLLFGVLLFVFQKIVRFGDQVPHYPVVLLFNIMLFTFFSEATSQAVTSVVLNEGIVRKTQFPRLVIPLASVLTGMLDLGLNMIAVFIFILAYGVGPYWTWLLLPVLFIPLLAITSAVAAILSSLYVRYRDMAIIWGVMATALFYGTPVLYTMDIVPQQFRAIISINPLTPIFAQARKWIIDPGAPGAVSAAGGWLKFAPSIAMFVVICALSIWVFNREAPRIAEEL
jgi:ABC-2 type transport system permease protein